MSSVLATLVPRSSPSLANREEVRFTAKMKKKEEKKMKKKEKKVEKELWEIVLRVRRNL